MNLLRWFFGRKEGNSRQLPEGDETSAGSDSPMTLTVKTDGLEQETQRAIWNHISGTSHIPVFSGRVEHGYSHRGVSGSDLCPRCHSNTERQYAHFIYATNTETRVMFAPAGFFCTRCPTVIVDEDIIARGMKGGPEFRGVVGLDNPKQKTPNPFDTWNGKEVVYIFDENEHIVGLSTADPLRGQSTIPRKSSMVLMKAKHRRRIAKNSRKRNRR